MRRLLAAMAASVTLTAPLSAGDWFPFEDAPLHAVQFTDREEGWAVGDEGVIWHTIDGGTTWERQPTGVRASLRAIQFLNPYTGWAVGREELPGSGSSGVILFTQDGGLKWRRVSEHALPGLNGVYFVDNRTGYLFGDGSEQFPSGLFVTTDSGRTWKPLAGPRSPSWISADFKGAAGGVLAGAWGRLANIEAGSLVPMDVDVPGGRAIRSVRVSDWSIAVGQGALVLMKSGAAAEPWHYAKLPLPPEVRAAWDLHSVFCLGRQAWVVGRPGTKMLHTADRGEHWDVLTTGQPLPLHAVYFADEHRGWAVGELGSILHTEDAGKTWRVQRRGGQRVAVLFVHAKPAGLPVETLPLVGVRDGYLAAALCLHAADPALAALDRAADADRWSAAVRLAGGAAGESLWQFPVPQYLTEGDRRSLLHAWDALHGDRAADEYLRQLVLALRIWRPDVVVTDSPDTAGSGDPAEALAAEAVLEAYKRAADPNSYPEQIHQLGLDPWAVGKLYSVCGCRPDAQVVLQLDEPEAALQAAPRDFAAPAASLLAQGTGDLPPIRSFRLVDARIRNALEQRQLTDGLVLAPAGVGRRELPPVRESTEEVLKAARLRRNLCTLARGGAGSLADPSKLMAELMPALAGMSDDQGAATALAVATQCARKGQWQLAREAFCLLIDRFPAHPLALNAYRWMIQHDSSSEAHRRAELGQFKVVGRFEYRQNGSQVESDVATHVGDTAPARVKGRSNGVREGGVALLSDRTDARHAFQSCLDAERRLAAFGPIFVGDPALQFCLQSARRNLGQSDAAREWYATFRKSHPAGPWGDAAAAELWLGRRDGVCPKPIAMCPTLTGRPYLDGNLDDDCWQEVKPMKLTDAVGTTAKRFPTEVWLAHDEEYLYLAVRCRHPEHPAAPPANARSHDADLRCHDRISLLLDLDRDYSTYYRLEVDERGCVSDDCWHDRTWNPHWYVAAKGDALGWQVEAAIPLAELTGEELTPGVTWACNVVRVIPAQGVQAWSVPADIEPRPEGMGLLMFSGETQAPKAH